MNELIIWAGMLLLFTLALSLDVKVSEHRSRCRHLGRFPSRARRARHVR